VAGTLAIGALVTILGVRETPTVKLAKGEKPSPEIAGTKEPPALIYPHQIRSYWWLIGSRFLFLLGIYDIQGFVNYYIRDVMNVENPVKLTGDLLAIITLALMAFAIGGGWAGDRFGHKRLQAVACVVGAVGCLLLLGARTPVTLLAFGSVLGAAIGLFLTSNWAMANKLSPASEAGKYLGLSNLATAGAGALARLAGPAIDLLNNTYSGMWYGYTAMFIFGAFATLGSAVVLRRVLIPQRAVISKQ
jgi:MFS family permease